MTRYYYDFPKVKLVVEFTKLDSPNAAVGTMYLIVTDEELKKVAAFDVEHERIPFEYSQAKGLHIFVDDKWQTEVWSFPVLKKLAQVAVEALKMVNIVPSRTEV